MGPGSSINHFKRAMVVVVIGLVKVLKILSKTWLLEHPRKIMTVVLMKGQCKIIPQGETLQDNSKLNASAGS